MTTPQRHYKGQVSVITSNGWLQLRFTYQGKRQYLSLGLKDDPENRKLAEAKAKLIESDITYERFDQSLEKYRNKAQQSSSKPRDKPQIQLDKLWNAYVVFRTPQVSKTTLKLNYVRVTNHIKKFPTRELEQAEKIRHYLVTNNSGYTAKRVLTQLNACCEWAVKTKLISSNPFRGMSTEVKRTGSSKEINPFTPDERDAIITDFAKHPVYTHYTNFVRFLFWTGCRTSEAVALRWRDIDLKFSYIVFSEAVVNVSSQSIRKECKTGKARNLPCNQQLKELLSAMYEEIKNIPETNRDALVFPSLTGQEINAHTFNALCWKGTTVRGIYRKGIVTDL